MPLLPVMAIMLVMLPRPAARVDPAVCMVEEACCIPMKAAAKLLTNLALLPVDDLETITCATVVPSTRHLQSVHDANSLTSFWADADPVFCASGILAKY